MNDRLKEIEERWNDPEIPTYTSTTIPDLLCIAKEQEETIARLEGEIVELKKSPLEKAPTVKELLDRMPNISPETVQYLKDLSDGYYDIEAKP